MLLIDDDANCTLNVNKKIAETRKSFELFPIKPIICKFFKPKVKCLSGHALMPPSNITNIIRIEKNTKPQPRSLQNCIKDEGLIKAENPHQCFSSTDSSSFSNLPSISLECSKTSESLSDPDNEDPNEMTLIVKNVYSLCKINQSNKKEINLPNVLNESNKSCKNKMTVTKKSSRKKTHFSKKKSKSKISKKSTLITDKEKEKSDFYVSDSEISDTPTEAMMFDVDDFKIQTNSNTMNFDLMQPFVVLERFEPERIAPYLVTDYETLHLTINLKSKSLVNKSSNKTSASLSNTDNTNSKIRKPPLSVTNKPSHHSIENDKLYCFVCDQSNVTACRNHPIKWIPNKNIDCPHVEYIIDESFDKYLHKFREKYYCNCNGNELEHIQNDLPQMFQLKESEKSEIGVWTNQLVTKGTIIGPYLGKVIENPKQDNLSNPYFTRGYSQSNLIEGLGCLQFAFKSNWLRCVRFTNYKEKVNLEFHQYNGNFFFQVVQDISSNLELLLFNEPNFRESPNEIYPDTDVRELAASDQLPNQISQSHAKFNRAKIDGEIIDYISELLRNCPQIRNDEINALIQKRFPKAPRFHNCSISRAIRIRGLRPLLGVDDKVDLETVQSIVSMVTKDKKLAVNSVQKRLLSQYPMKGKLDCQTIDKIIKLNFCRLYNKKFKQNFDNRKVVKEIKRLVKSCDGAISRREIHDKINEKMADKNNISMDYICHLIRKFAINIKSAPPKCDDEMKSVINQLHFDNPSLTAPEINLQLKSKLPDKPAISSKTIHNLLRKSRIV